MTNPSRSRSNGREARSGSSLRVLSAFMAENPARPIATIEASDPPARKISASPNLMVRQDSPMALFDVPQAVLHRDESARHIADQHRNREWRSSRRSFCQEDRQLILQRF